MTEKRTFLDTIFYFLDEFYMSSDILCSCIHVLYIFHVNSIFYHLQQSTFQVLLIDLKTARGFNFFLHGTSISFIAELLILKVPIQCKSQEEVSGCTLSIPSPHRFDTCLSSDVGLHHKISVITQSFYFPIRQFSANFQLILVICGALP